MNATAPTHYNLLLSYAKSIVAELGLGARWAIMVSNYNRYRLPAPLPSDDVRRIISEVRERGI